MENQTYKTVADIQKLLQVSRQAVYAWIKSGKLKSYKVGKYRRIKPEDLKNFIEGR